MDVKQVVPPGSFMILGRARTAGLYRIDAGGRALTMAGFSATHAVEQARRVLLAEWRHEYPPAPRASGWRQLDRQEGARLELR